MTKKPHPLLSKARSFWRLARKADRAGSKQGEHYRKVADLAYRRYLSAAKPQTRSD